MTNYDILKEYETHKTPVPSYDEWQAKNEENKNLYKMLDVLNGHLDSLLKEKEENQHLKELLKEWIHFYPIILYEHEDTLKTKDIVELFDKTREVIK